MKRAIPVLAAAVAFVVVAAVLDAQVPAAHRELIGIDVGWTAGLPGLGLVVPGAILLRRLPRHPVAWLLCGSGLHWCMDGAAGSWLAYATYAGRPGADAAFWIYQRLGATLLIWLPLLLLIYPTGRFPKSLFAYASLAAASLAPLLVLIVPSEVAQARDGVPLPAPFATLDLDPFSVPLPDGWWPPLLSAAWVLLPLGVIGAFALVVRRYRAATGDDRLALRWLTWAAVVDVLVMVAQLVVPELAGVVLGPAIALTGGAIAVALVRPRLVDVDRLLGGTLLYAAMAVTVLVVDACVLGATGALLGERLAERDAAVLALLLVVAVYGPLRHRLWLAVRRLVLGRRDDPYRVVAGLAEQLERSRSPEDELLAVARAVGAAFRSPYVAVEVDRAGGERLVATCGEPAGPTRALPITYRGETVGRVVLPASGARVALSARDERLLGDVVRQAAIAARSAYLAQELQRSREQIVAAREEERRRLRRDLHDGLGPALGGVALRIDTARNLAARDRARNAVAAGDRAGDAAAARNGGKDAGAADVDKLLKQAREDITAAVADVRRLVHDLRPPALDDVGLLGAVRQQAARLRAPGLTVTVDGGDGLEGLPAAVEVAAYRIASEALTNVARHAAAATCRVKLSVTDGALLVEVVDDGVGIAAGTPAGVGLVSLRERAAELGGDCRIECPDGRGTAVRARLPMGVLV